MSDAEQAATRFDVLVAGPVYCDLVFGGLEDLPRLGTEVFAPRLFMTAGGSAITAVALRRLRNAVALTTDLGNDLAGETVLKALAAEGVAPDLLIVHRGAPTPTTAVLSTHSDRAFVTNLPTYRNGAKLSEALATNVVRHLHVGGFPVAMTQPEALTMAATRGITTSFDPGWDESCLRSAEVRSYALHCDIFMPSLLEAQAIAAQPLASAAEAARVLAAKRNGRLTVVKDGARGAAAAQGDSVFTAEPPSVEVVDATGAGDVFDAVFLDSWLSERSLEESLRRAVVGGALAVTAHGGFGGAPYKEDLESVEF